MCIILNLIECLSNSRSFFYAKIYPFCSFYYDGFALNNIPNIEAKSSVHLSSLIAKSSGNIAKITKMIKNKGFKKY